MEPSLLSSSPRAPALLSHSPGDPSVPAAPVPALPKGTDLTLNGGNQETPLSSRMELPASDALLGLFDVPVTLQQCQLSHAVTAATSITSPCIPLLSWT